MSRISKIDATAIATLFNTIEVSGGMKRTARAEFDRGEIDFDKWIHLDNLWDEHCKTAEDKLIALFGITPVCRRA